MYVVLCKCIFGTFCCCTLKLEPTSRIQNLCTQFASWILFSTPGLTLKHIKPSTLRNQSGWSRNNNRNELPATPKPVTQLAFSTRQSQPSSTNNVSVILFTSDNTGSHSGHMANHRCIKLSSSLTKPKRNFIRNYD